MILYRNQYELPAVNFFASYEDLGMLVKDGEIQSPEDFNQAVEFQSKMQKFSQEFHFDTNKNLRNKIFLYADYVGRLNTLLNCSELMLWGSINNQIEALLKEFRISKPEDIMTRLSGYKIKLEEAKNNYSRSVGKNELTPIEQFNDALMRFEKMLNHPPDSKMTLSVFISYLKRLVEWEKHQTNGSKV